VEELVKMTKIDGITFWENAVPLAAALADASAASATPQAASTRATSI
jgi:hypothetical protein